MLTEKQWKESQKPFNEFVWSEAVNNNEPITKDGYIEIDEDISDYFLCVLPPIWNRENKRFLCSEPMRFDSTGHQLYMAFISKDKKYYYCGLKTKQWVKE